MKKSIIIMFGIIVFISNESNAYNNFTNYTLGKSTLSGKISDKKTGESLPGVSIYFPDLKTGATSDADGKYKIDNLPQTKVLVQVSYIGYKLIAENIDLSTTKTKDFALEESVTELHEVVVTGLSNAAEKNRTPTPILTIPPIQLLQNSSANIIDALAQQPGVSEVTTGSGISKPVIRGLGYNRVVTVNDGIRQEGQQWGDEHGIEIDEFSVNKVEILKGPASLAYGSDAMAGVINMITAPTLPDGKIQGNILANYQTNDGLIGYSANIAGNQKGLIWDVRYSNKMAHSYQNKYDGYVFNSGYKENAVTGIIGLNKSWGYSHLHFSAYNLTPGIVEGKRDSATGKFVKPVALNDSTAGSAIAGENDFKSYKPLTPYQKIHHYKAVLNNDFIIGDGSLKATIGFQQNQRQEYADILDINHYGLYFFLNTVNYDVRYILPEKNNFNFSFGANGMEQTSQNKGTEYLIPEYNLFDIGVFAIAKKTIDKLDISGGLRYDSRNENGKDLYINTDGEQVDANTPDAYHKFTAFNSTFTGVSGSIGATYQFSENVFSKLNISRGFRAPNIAEVSANGVHEGTINYIIGEPGLKAENSLQFDYALGYNTNHVTAEVDLFSNTINNFIFLRKLESVSGGDSLTNGYSTFKYSSGDANLSGVEISVDIHPHPLDWLHFENTFSYVQAIQKNQPDSTKYLPFTPPAKYTSELKATAKKLGKRLANAYVKFAVEHYFIQNKFYSAYGTETATSGYTLLNCGIGTDVISNNKTLFSIYISADNLAGVAYQSHLSRLKYEDVNYATGRTGVYNMGRNFSFKLIVPVDFRQ
ncbi:MAG: TonB-dependent receptor [Bacteroidia bacterium]|nr:TonB-dependent receptor [Bacteroidia bacterium]